LLPSYFCAISRRCQRLRRDDRSQLDQHLPSEAFRLGGQLAALVVSEAQSLVAQLLLHDAILFAKIIDKEELRLFIQPDNAIRTSQNGSRRRVIAE